MNNPFLLRFFWALTAPLRRGQKHYAGCFAQRELAERRAEELWEEHSKPLDIVEAILEAEIVVPKKKLYKMKHE